jgi:5'-nucleotidase
VVLALSVATVALSTAVLPASANNDGGSGGSTTVKLLAFNDFHGNLDPPTGSGGLIRTSLDPTNPQNVPAGGAEYLATHLDALGAGDPSTLVVSAGDNIGASPLLSAAFHDEPTIEAFNAFGVDTSSVGNHEFDEGVVELFRMQYGACLPTPDSCADGDFGGADFTYTAANVVNTDSGRPILPPYWIGEVPAAKGSGKAKVGFIGMTLEDTASIVTASGIRGVEFRDEVESANALVPQLRRAGVEAIVVLVHEGGTQNGLYNECRGLTGPIVEIATAGADGVALDPEIDAVVSAHTHQAYNCSLPDPAGQPRLVTSAASFGRLITEINLVVDRRGEVDRAATTAVNRIVTRDVPKDPELSALIAKYRTLVAPIANRKVGEITADLLRQPDASGESPLGNVIADAQLADTAPAAKGGAQLALMNPGGIRADLVFAPDGVVTYEEAFTVQPFNNYVVTMTLTGAQLDAVLEQQFDNPSTGANRILQVSKGFTYTWNPQAPTGSKVDPASIQLNGQPVEEAGAYRVTVNSFLADGGDNFTVLRQGADRVVGGLDIDALTAYLGANSPLSPPPTNRINIVP